MTHNAQHKTDNGQDLSGLGAGAVPAAQSTSKRLMKWAAGLSLALGLVLCLAVLGVRSINFSDTNVVNTTLAVAHAAEEPAKKPDGATEIASIIHMAKASNAPEPLEIVEVTESVDMAQLVRLSELAHVPKIADALEIADVEKISDVVEIAEVVDAPEKPIETAPKPAEKKVDTPKKPPSIKLFGTVEFRGTLKGVPSWTTMLERNLKKPLLVAGAKLNSSTTWDDFKAKLATMSPMEQLKTVNRFWNQWPYRLDPEVYKKPDYWATPDEFRRNSGDCEDYSIVKYYTLKEMGIPPDDMRIVVLMETIRNIAHAVLVVYMDGDAWILDNLSHNVLSHSRYKNYDPQFSVNEKFRWAHVRPK